MDDPEGQAVDGGRSQDGADATLSFFFLLLLFLFFVSLFSLFSLFFLLFSLFFLLFFSLLSLTFLVSVFTASQAVWSTKANDTLCALTGRLPAMSDRSWNPQVP